MAEPTILDTFAKIGQFLSGVGFIATALIALFTLRVVNMRQVDEGWLDRFRGLYEAFWRDREMAEVRRWIINEVAYKREIEPVLKARNSSPECFVDKKGHAKLEMIDHFCSVIARIRSFETWRMTATQRDLYGKILNGHFWIKKIESREELNTYIENHWREIKYNPPTRSRVVWTRNRVYIKFNRDQQ